MDTLTQIQTLIKQSSENNECIQKKMKWFADKQDAIQTKINDLNNIYINNSKEFIEEQRQKLTTKLQEYKQLAEETIEVYRNAAEAWINEQKELLMQKLKDMIAKVIKAKTL